MKRRLIVALPIVAAVVLLDQATKALAVRIIHPLMSMKVFPGLNLVNVRNTGAAFGMFSEFGNTFFITISLVAIVFMIWVILSGREDHRIFALLLGGAAGNLIDRVRLGYVVDFLDLYVASFHWPAFNVADSALTIGIGLLVFRLLRGKF